MTHFSTGFPLHLTAGVGFGEAIEVAYTGLSSESRILKDAAEILLRDIQEARLASSGMSWPSNVASLTDGMIFSSKSVTMMAKMEPTRLIYLTV